MRRNTTIAVGVAAGVTAIALAATPAVALGSSYFGAANGQGSGQNSEQCNGQGNGSGNGMGNRQGRGNGQGNGMGQGQGQGQGMSGLDLTGVASGTLTADQKTKLAGMAEEEKMAHDLYVALAAKYPADHQFANIAKAETKHLTAVRTLLTRYGIADPTAGKAEGSFASERMQTLYNQLLAGATTSQAALAAGVTVEKTDIADLANAKVGVTAPDVNLVYTNLTQGSEHHLKAFGG